MSNKSKTTVALLSCPFCGEQPAQSSCIAPELVRCVNDKTPHCPASFGGVSVETWNRRSPELASECHGAHITSAGLCAQCGEQTEAA